MSSVMNPNKTLSGSDHSAFIKEKKTGRRSLPRSRYLGIPLPVFHVILHYFRAHYGVRRLHVITNTQSRRRAISRMSIESSDSPGLSCFGGTGIDHYHVISIVSSILHSRSQERSHPFLIFHAPCEKVNRGLNVNLRLKKLRRSK